MTWTGWNVLFANKRASQLSNEANATSHTTERHTDPKAPLEHLIRGSMSLGKRKRPGSATRSALKKLKTAVGQVFLRRNIRQNTLANNGPNQSMPHLVFTDCNGKHLDEHSVPRFAQDEEDGISMCPPAINVQISLLCQERARELEHNILAKLQRLMFDSASTHGPGTIFAIYTCLTLLMDAYESYAMSFEVPHHLTP